MTLPSCIRTQPSLVFDASQNTSKDFLMFGWARIGAMVNSFRKVWKAASHSSIQANL
jgi:hypothetical protein